MFDAGQEIEMLRFSFVSLAALSVASGCSSPGSDPSPEVVAEAGAEAAAAADQLFVALRDELMGAMQSGGPVAAVPVCKDRAPEIAAAIEADTGVDIERTALRVRNVGNAPSDWERETMEAFVSRRAGGEAWAEMSASRVEGDTLHWMRPIPMGEVCVVCHGDAEIAEETRTAISAAYPDDMATGFAVGELRGAFVAQVPLVD